EKMQAEHALLLARGRGDGGDVERGSVRSEQSLRRAERIELLEDLALELEFFRRRFDDQVGLLAIFQADRRAKAIQGFLFLLGGDPAALAAALQKILHPADAGIDEFL